jgi:UTP--glucose-1-phosphate uridylyltransferase
MYCLKILDFFTKTPVGGGEIQLTDAIDMLIVKNTVDAFNMTGKSQDCRGKLGHMYAFFSMDCVKPT